MSNYRPQTHPQPCDPLCLTGPLSRAGPAPHCLPGASAVQAGTRGCPERRGHWAGRGQGTGMVTEVQKGDPGAVGVQSKCRPDLGSKEYPENKDRRRAGRQDQSRGLPEFCLGAPAPLGVWYSLSPHPAQGWCDPWGLWRVRAQPPPLPFLDQLLRAEEGHAHCTWAAEGVECPPWEQRRSGAPPHLAGGGVSPARCPGSRTAVRLCLTWGPGGCED